MRRMGHAYCALHHYEESGGSRSGGIFAGFRFSSNRHKRQKELIRFSGQFLDDSGRLLHDMVDPVQFDL